MAKQNKCPYCNHKFIGEHLTGELNKTNVLKNLNTGRFTNLWQVGKNLGFSSKATMFLIGQSLIKNGLIKRERGNSKIMNKREYTVKITSKGKKLLEELK